MPNDKKKNSAYDTRVNVTGLLRRLQVKIRKYLSLQNANKKNMKTSLKAGFAQTFSCCPKKSELPKIWGGAAAPLARPPTPTPPPPLRPVRLCS